MFSIVKVARDQTKPGSLLAHPGGQLDERPRERGWAFLNKDLQFLEGLEESFRGNSRIISDCWACSILKTLSGCLYASRNFLKFVYLWWRSK